MAEPTVNLTDVPPLPGPAASWAPGESTAGMPAADEEVGKDVTSRIAQAKRSEIATTDKIYGEFESTLNRSMARLDKLSKNAGVEADKLKPWNEEEESAKRHTDPIVAFGSLGSVLGILASAFTHAPMENALNASAAAMNAIRANDAKEYERAHKAWQENGKLALERHQIEHQVYQDAASLLKTNMEAAGIKLRVAAARFGDQKILAMLDAGMDKDVVDVINSRQKVALQLAEQMPKITLANAEMSRLFALGYNPKDPESEKSQHALVQFNEERAALKQKEHSIYGRGALTMDRQNAMAVEEYKNELRAAKTEDGKPKYTKQEIADKGAERYKELKAASSPITANRADELQGKINRVDLALTLVNDIDQLLVKHKAITGIGGMLTRPPEIISNILGSNETDREQFKRDVETMRLMAPRILLDTRGRPISAEAERVNTMIAGLSPGDTGPNTIRAYVEFRRQLEQIKKSFEERVGKKPAESDLSAKPSYQPSWRDAPVVR